MALLSPEAPELVASAASEKMTVVYADGPHDAETLLFDPSTKELLIATKSIGSGSAVHRVGPVAAGQKVKVSGNRHSISDARGSGISQGIPSSDG